MLLRDLMLMSGGVLDISAATRTDETTDAEVIGASNDDGGGWWRDSGSRLFLPDGTVNSADFSTDFDLSSTISAGSTKNENSVGLALSDDGLSILLNESNSTLADGTLSTAWLASSITAGSSKNIKNVAGSNFTSTGGTASRDGAYAFVFDVNASKIYRYSMSTAWDVTSIQVSGEPDTGQTLDVTSGPTAVTAPRGIAISHNGKYLYLTDFTEDAAYQWFLSTAYDLTTASFVGELIDATYLNQVRVAITHPTNEKKVYFAGVDYLAEYTMGA